MARQYGLSRQVQGFDHPILKEFDGDFQLIRRPLHDSRQGIQQAILAGDEWVPVQVFATSDSQLVVFPSREIGPHCTFQNKNQKPSIVEQMDFAEFQSLDCTQDYLSLQDVFKLFPRQKFWLSISSNHPRIHIKLQELIASQQAQNRVITHSDYSVIVSSLRKLEPGWIYASGKPDAARVFALNSMYIETLWAPPTDIVVLDLYLGNRPQVHERMVKELQRQGRKVVLRRGIDQKKVEELLSEGWWIH